MNTNDTTALTAIDFGGIPPVKRPVGNAPLLQWFNGLPAGRALATGWHIQANRCPEALTAALKACGYERVTVLHRMTGELVEYWAIEACSLFFLCNGFDDVWQMKQSPDREGLAYGWIEARQHSKVKVRVIIEELAAMGYLEPLEISLEGHITDDFLKALEQQFRVLDAFQRLAGKPAPFYGFSLTLQAAEKPRIVGKEPGKMSPIVPIVAEMPQAIDAVYLKYHLCPREVLAAIAERDLIGQAVRWSVETSRRISRGEDRESWETEEYAAALKGAPADFLEVEDSEEQAEKATKQQIASIRNLLNLLPGRKIEEEPATYDQAKAMIAELSKEFNAMKNGKANNKRA